MEDAKDLKSKTAIPKGFFGYMLPIQKLPGAETNIGARELIAYSFAWNAPKLAWRIGNTMLVCTQAG